MSSSFRHNQINCVSQLILFPPICMNRLLLKPQIYTLIPFLALLPKIHFLEMHFSAPHSQRRPLVFLSIILLLFSLSFSSIHLFHVLLCVLFFKIFQVVFIHMPWFSPDGPAENTLYYSLYFGQLSLSDNAFLYIK